MPRRQLKYLPQYLAISPFFILFAVFGVYPVLYSLYLALQRWDGIGPMQWVGLDNFKFLVTDGEFWNAVGNTFIIWIMSTVPMTVLALLIAVGLNSSIRFKGLYRIAYFMPNVTSVVAIAIVFSSVFAEEFGILNATMTWLGLEPADWLTNPWGLKAAISVMIIWRWAGYNAIIFLAAKVDGCGFFRTYWNIALPVLRPALAFLGIFTFINAWNDYLWPLIVMVDSQNVTLQVALNQLNGIYGTDYSLVMAGTLLAIIPLLVVFLFGARHFIRNIAAGAVKG